MEMLFRFVLNFKEMPEGLTENQGQYGVQWKLGVRHIIGIPSNPVKMTE
jgi:hypothetical protein